MEVSSTGKRIALTTAKHAGIFRVMQRSRWRRQRLLILCYHGVSLRDEHQWNPTLYVRPEHLEKRLCALRTEGYRVLGLEEGVRRLYTGNLPERSVAITFDDGAYDFYQQAYPILCRYGAPVTVYLTSYYCSYNQPVFPGICSYLLWKGRDRSLTLPGVLREPSFELRKAEARRSAWNEVTGHAERLGMSAAEKNELAARVASALGLDYGEMLAARVLHLMNSREIGELSAAGVDFQLHTHRHRVPLDHELFAREIVENRQIIQRITGRAAHHFCYPSGVVSPIFIPWLRQLEVTSAVTCESGIASVSDDPLTLPRFQDSSDVSDLQFEGWATGFIPFANAAGRRK
jgi:peptidoglycan/xylan/chitin deacetylase (PgdA/CDA1 family)